MSQVKMNKRVWAGSLMAGLTLFAFTEPAFAILGRWATAAVVVSATKTAEAGAVAASSAAASQQQAAAAASAQSAAAAQQSAAAAQAAAARATAPPPAPEKTPKQKLAELQSLYDQGLISQSDYQAAKTKIINAMMN
jgi:hypothetical protein